MNKFDIERRNNYIKKLVSNSRSILTNQISIPLGSQKMTKILFWINPIAPIEEIDFSIFNELNNQTINFPIGKDRIEYNADFLIKLDIQLNEVVVQFKEDILNKCIEIVDKLG